MHLPRFDGNDIRGQNDYLHYYAALLPRRGPHIASHSVCLSIRLSVRLSVCPSVPLSLPSVTSRHLANYNDTHVLFGTRSGPHIVRPSRPHKFLFDPQLTSFSFVVAKVRTSAHYAILHLNVLMRLSYCTKLEYAAGSGTTCRPVAVRNSR